MKAKELVQALWAKRCCLAVSEMIMFADGRIALLKVNYSSNPITFKVKAWQLITDFLDHDWKPDDDYIDCPVQLCSCRVPAEGLLISAGECTGYGSEGYVALIDEESDRLRWLLFLWNSNPFKELIYDKGMVLARSTSGYPIGDLYRLPLDHPEQGWGEQPKV